MLNYSQAFVCSAVCIFIFNLALQLWSCPCINKLEVSDLCLSCPELWLPLPKDFCLGVYCFLLDSNLVISTSLVSTFVWVFCGIAVLLSYPIAATQTHPKDACYSVGNVRVSDPFEELNSFLFHFNRFCSELWFTMFLKVSSVCGIVLLCYLTLKVGNSEALEQLWTSNSLRGDSSFCSSTNMITLLFIRLEIIP